MAGSSFRYTWAAAEIRWGYHVAASLAGCELLVNSSGSRLSARVTSADPFRLSQRPIVFRINRSPVPWRWPIESLQIDGGLLTAQLGPQFEE
jgi:hypothetical protein